jgi:hypothetical protein
MDINTFLDYVMKDCCGCIKEECDIKFQGESLLPVFVARYTTETTEPTNERCNYITTNESTVLPGTPKKDIIQKIIELFVKNNLIKMDTLQRRYFLLSTKKPLTWESVKTLMSMDVDDKVGEMAIGLLGNKDSGILVKGLFWYFRKAIVDTLVSQLIEKHNRHSSTKVMGVSVGSTNLDSDYDITLYGPDNATARVIDKFNETIQTLFGDTSGRVFDTNIYGASFITLDEKGSNVCGGKRFNYTQAKSAEGVFEQHMWAYVKLYAKIYEKFQNVNALLHEIDDNVFAQQAREHIRKHESDLQMYSKTLLSQPSFTEGAGTTGATEGTGTTGSEDVDGVLGLNKISFVNYYGSETYYTRGAFLDVVVNQQMCRKDSDRTNRVVLTDHDYIDSFIENMSELIGHFGKQKYTKRALYALDNLADDIGNKNSIKKTLQEIMHLQKVCERSVLDCQEFVILLECIRCINLVMASYTFKGSPVGIKYPGKGTLANLSTNSDSRDSLIWWS